MIDVVADNNRNVDVEFTCAPPVEEVVQAVRLLRRQEGDPLTLVGEPQAPGHLELVCDRRERRRYRRPVEVEAVELELDSLEERAVGVVGVLLEIDDVAAVGG